MSFWDAAIVTVYLAVVVGKGVRLARKQTGVDDYFLAGRSMGWFAVGVSVIASLFSGISYLGAPTESYRFDLQYSVGLLTIPLVTPVVIVVFLPFYHGLKAFTAYEYLEKRFGVAVRALASGLFILWRMGWMALVLYAPSLALSEFVGLRWEYAIIITGVASTLYTVMGGITAVIWTDVIQFFVLFAGITAVALVCSIKVEGGPVGLWGTASAAGKLRMVDWGIPADGPGGPGQLLWHIATQRLTIWAVVLGGLFTNLAAYATDQVAIQRYLTTKSLAECRRSLIFHAAVIIPICVCFYYVGTMMWAFYEHYPELRPVFEAGKEDRILPFFVMQQLPVGLRGLVIAALFAATMSSMDSGINSVTTATLMDFGRGLLRKRPEEARQLQLARIWTVVWGTLTIGCALAAGWWGKTLVEMTNKVAGLFAGPLLGIFLLGMLTRRANQGGTLIAGLAGFALVICTVFRTEVSFMLYTLIGCVTTLILGALLSLLFPQPEEGKLQGLVWRAGAAATNGQEPE